MNSNTRFRLGVVVNPFAGIGGAVALKGSDGAAIREKALAQGAEQKAAEKMCRALMQLQGTDNLLVFTAAGEMGMDSCQQAGLSAEVVYSPQTAQTEAEHTQQAARAMMEKGIDLLLFAGGDGTARNLYDELGTDQVVLGVPAGVKIHSGVYAVTPSAAGKVALKMAMGELVSEFDAEVRDIDEDAFRHGNVTAKYYGEMRVPRELEYIQAVKMGGKEHEELVLDDIAAYVSEMIEQDDETCYVMGSGSTVAAIMDALNLDNTLLGVDVICAGRVIGSDVSAKTLLEITDGQPVKLIVTLIGGQGHILGRGNQQLSPAFIKRLGKQNMLIVSTKQKLQALEGRPLRFDSGDDALDEALSGSVQVITGYQDKVLYPAV
ncbi:ATP-NAD kinase family protein [Salinimonas sp. HHU 13199]|uniref:ATP-NAD kinase family protein n=1 Tax=Salinimonas profundi TaxID=2729140 RepID=A0ABR8LFR8_9ALTE|nr:ATP-NAD kinase family protein [Salinimonas profundi]MBD3584145.1 ATP-NAD kinase family protein [Salinimonas profundi]